jgi:AraC-like DNA-binding protein
MRRIQTILGSSLKRHCHITPYAALVLSGGYEEAGDNGFFQVSAGDVLLHGPFEAHLNRFSAKGVTVLNLPLNSGCCPGIGRADDPDAFVRLAEKNVRDASHLLLSLLKMRTGPIPDWPAELAMELTQCSWLRLSEWGEKKGLAPWAVTRGFVRVFGISPEAFRARSRARRAFRAIRGTDRPLALIAAELGFSDQAHMTRSVKQLTGTVPCVWRRPANGFKTQEQCGI